MEKSNSVPEATAQDFKDVPFEALCSAHAELFNYARSLEAALQEKGLEVQHEITARNQVSEQLEKAEQDLEDERRAHIEIASVIFAAGVEETDDRTSTSAAYNAARELSQARAENERLKTWNAQMLRMHTEELTSERDTLRAESLRFYHADGTFETLASAEEVIELRKAAAVEMEQLRIRLETVQTECDAYANRMQALERKLEAVRGPVRDEEILAALKIADSEALWDAMTVAIWKDGIDVDVATGEEIGGATVTPIWDPDYARSIQESQLAAMPRIYILLQSGLWSSDGTAEHTAPRVQVVGAWLDQSYAEHIRDTGSPGPGWVGAVSRWVEESRLDTSHHRSEAAMP